MLEVSFVAAFAGGVLSLLAPCSALLLPAFFAYAFTSRTELLGRTLLFLAGLSTVFVPLGIGASLVAALLLTYRELMVALAGLLLVVFGSLELVGVALRCYPRRWRPDSSANVPRAPCMGLVWCTDWRAFVPVRCLVAC